ncbi:uncharacterized protein LOC132035475 isoform X3 [Lycium ferocissimum]|uniref:uncharacterized protein LOC132035475 isoform X3 n=1 Tax=Lycium ferocissimum TaxID=112874 RepID=UPI002816119C|nr:uncharacterized protein LOC132035475 isoform X3 [Lycium ferocissimum]
MRVLTNRLSRALWSVAFSSSSTKISSRGVSTFIQSKHCLPNSESLFASPWSATQLRGAKFRGADLKPGNVIEKKGRMYQVVKAQHSTQGRGGAIIQVELRDVDSGSKSNERFRTDEPVENDMNVNVQLYDGRAMSASIPTRATCTVAESEMPMRASATPQYKKVLLDNGLTVQVPKHIVEGDKIIINTADHSYLSRA